MHLLKNLTRARAETQLVIPVGAGRPQSMRDNLNFRYRSKLQIALTLTTTLFPHPFHKFFKITWMIQERLAVIGERK
jgi:hypothetical protein